MEEKIIFVNSGNETELLRTLSKFNINSIGTRVFNNVDLIDYVATKLGIYHSHKVLSLTEEVLLYQKAIEQNKNKLKYFENSNSYEDVLSIVRGIHVLRTTSLSDLDVATRSNLLKSFKQKNEAILALYDCYKKEKDNDFDEIDYMYFVINELEKQKETIKFNIVTLKGYLYSALDQKLVELLANKSFSDTLVSPRKLFKLDEKDNSFNDLPVYSVYGEYNEVLNVLKIINDNNYKLDECEIIVVDYLKYYPYFKELEDLLNIKVTYGNGYPLSNTKPGMLLKNLYNYSKFDKFGRNGIKEVFTNSYLDYELIKKDIGFNDYKEFRQLLNVAGNLRLSFDWKKNKEKISKFNTVDEKNLTDDEEVAKKYLDAFNKIISKGYDGLIRNYFKKTSKEDGVARLSLLDSINTFSKCEDLEEYIPYILSVNIGSSVSEEGSLFVTNLKNGLFSLRKNIFVLGLSSDAFPTHEKENFVALDEDLININKDSRLSTNRQKEDVELFNEFINLCLAKESNVYLSYSSYDLKEVRGKNKASILYNLKNVTEINKYFDSNFLNKYGKCYLDNKKVNVSGGIIDNPSFIVDATKIFTKDHKLSPSSLEPIYLNNDSEYDFLTKSMLGIYYDCDIETYKYIQENEFGNIIHDIFKNAKSPLDLSNLNDLKKTAIETFKKTHDPIVSEKVTMTKFDRQINNGYNLLKDVNMVFREEPLEGLISGIYFGGKCDLIAEKEGHLDIYDYKTGKPNHNFNDKNNAIQGLLYAALYDETKPNKRIVFVNFDYLNNKIEVPYLYAKDEITNILDIVNDDGKVTKLCFKNKVKEIDFKMKTYNPLIEIENK